MARDPWKKFGSPYDPAYQGKGKLPPEQEAKRGRQMQLGGCGDPTCAMCNPESAEAIRNMGGSRSSLSDLLRDAILGGGSINGREGIFTIRDMKTVEDYILYGDGSREGAGPPKSYVAAREKVEQWINKAPTQAFEDIVGNDEALEQLRDAIQAPVKHKKVYEAYGMKMPKGALLSGPPGCGKTMFARAAAAEMTRLYGKEAEFISISGSELQQPYIGVTEKFIKAIFTFGREYFAYHGHPLLVFMDEAEVLLPDRTGRVRRVAPWEESQVATFLAEMDGMNESGVFLLLASNRPEVIDQAVLRDGRCDFKITVKRPTAEAVEVILRKNFVGVLVHKQTSIDELVFAAVESLHDPHKVLIDAHALDMNEEGKLYDAYNKHFLLEHIVSGAMAASIPGRAKRYAFARDKETGKALGVTVDDVVRSVNDLFEENRGLEHSFALEEFRKEFFEEASQAVERKRKK